MRVVLIVCLVLAFSTPAHAGFLSGFLSSSAANLMTGGGQNGVAKSDMDDINAYLWGMVQQKKFIEDYEFYAEFLEETNDYKYLDTAAWAYFLNGEKARAKDLYETRVLPYMRHNQAYVNTYREFAELKDGEAIDYHRIYEKAADYRHDAIEASKGGSSSLVLWLILIVLGAHLWFTYTLLNRRTA